MAINFSNTVPSAPSGGSNVSFQTDGSGNVSAYTGLASVKTTVAPIAGVLTLDCSLGNSFLITWNANITSMSLTNPTDGQEITLLWEVDVTGGYTITPAANLLGFTTPSNTASKNSTQKFTYNSGNTNWYSLAVGVTGL